MPGSKILEKPEAPNDYFVSTPQRRHNQMKFLNIGSKLSIAQIKTERNFDWVIDCSRRVAAIVDKGRST